jgi:hypothetical protein
VCTSAKKAMDSVDPDILGSLPALRRAARAARRLAEKTGTPFYVLQGGRIVNLNPTRRRRAPARPTRARANQVRPQFADEAMRELKAYRKTGKAADWTDVKRKLGL